MGIQLNRLVIVEIVLCVFIVLVLSRTSTSVEQPANFVFGDSLVDAGNNNYIASISKANFLPFGVDLGRPTGRFTNGRTIVDILGKIITFFFSLFFSLLSLMCCLDFYLSICLMTLFSCITIRSGIGYWFYPTLLGSHYSWTSGSERCQLCLWWRWNPKSHWQNPCKFLLQYLLLKLKHSLVKHLKEMVITSLYILPV